MSDGKQKIRNARHRAFERLAVLHKEEFLTLYDAERAKAGLPPRRPGAWSNGHLVDAVNDGQVRGGD